MRRLSRGLVVAYFAAGATAAHADFEVQTLAIATVFVAATTIGQPTPSEPNYVAFEVGRFDAYKNVQPATSFGAEYRFGKLLVWKLRPFVGADVTSDHSFYGYGGLRFSAYWGDHIVVTPSAAFGGYSPGAGKSLGNPAFIGRFGIDLDYSLSNDMRVGVAYHHMSNGKLLLQETNPGTEIIGVTFAIALH